MKLENSRILITGAAGVIGTVLTEKLQNTGAKILAADLKKRPDAFNNNVEYRRGDLNYITQDDLERFNPDIVFHLAATFERASENYPFYKDNFHHNVQLSHHLLSCFKELENLKTITFASSYLIYDKSLYFGQAETRFLSEDDPIAARNLTGSAKLNHEIELEFISQFKDIRTVSARIFRSYGRDSRDVVSRFIRSLTKNETIEVYDKNSKFDYIFADDVAEGLFRMAQNQSCEGIINLGSGNPRKISELISILRTHFPNARIIEHDSENQSLEKSAADTSLLQTTLGWVPDTTLEQGVQAIIEFEKTRPETENTNPNILITSISKKVPLIESVREAVGKIGSGGQIYGADIDGNCIGRHYVDHFWQMPNLLEIGLLEFIGYCKSHEIGAIIPTRDGELDFFAKNRKVLKENGISVMIASDEAIEHCLHKGKFYEYLKDFTQLIIPTFTKLTDCGASRLVVKESHSSGSRDILLDVSPSEAENHSFKSPIFQPFVEGQEFSGDLYYSFQSKKLHGMQLRWREKVVAGESQITTTFNNKELEQQIERALEPLKLEGAAVVQGVIDDSGKLHIIEVNARFGGASTLGIAAGVDSFYWFLLEMTGQHLPEFVKSKGEKRLIRAPADRLVENCETLEKSEAFSK